MKKSPNETDCQAEGWLQKFKMEESRFMQYSYLLIGGSKAV